MVHIPTRNIVINDGNYEKKSKPGKEKKTITLEKSTFTRQRERKTKIQQTKS